MTTTTLSRCENLACMCEVPATQGTCSDACASREGHDPQAIVCGCEHATCATASEQQLHGEAGSENPA